MIISPGPAERLTAESTQRAGTAKLLQWFAHGHLPAGPARDTSAACSQLANAMAADLPSGAELSAGLRKLLEAKDCFVRAALDQPRS